MCRTDEDAVTACGSVYGIDILPDNVQECRERIEKWCMRCSPVRW